MGRLAGTATVVGIWLLLAAPMALADPPGPTNYQSEVTEIDPPAIGLDIEIVGGDSFILLRAGQGFTVEVIGYQGEPYLRYLPDGTVEENAASPSKYLNEERYGGDLPDGANAAAPPSWVVVATDGSFAWHDHRTHWMNPAAPPGLAPGDQVAEGVVPLLWNGVEVDVTVVSVWQDPPSVVPVIVGMVVGVTLGYGLYRRRNALLLPAIVVLALAATLVGVVGYRSVPEETAPSWSLWALPATALLLVLLVAMMKRFGDVLKRHRTTLLLIAALELVAWGVMHWGWLWPAVLPTALPYWLDRLLASTVLVGSVGAAATALAVAAAGDAQLAD